MWMGLPIHLPEVLLHHTVRKLCDACAQGNCQNVQLLANSEKLSWPVHFKASILGKGINWSVMVRVSEIGRAARANGDRDSKKGSHICEPQKIFGTSHK